MKATPLDIPDVVLIEPQVHRDPRGFFLESYHRERYAKAGIHGPFVQFNHSLSEPGTLRGLHAQLEPPQGKLVRALEGSILDVAVDVRRGSPTFGRWVSAELSASNFAQLWIPPGFLHGFAALSRAQVEYACTSHYEPRGEIVVAWDDPGLAIAWPVSEPLLSDRDAAAPRLAAILERLPAYAAPGRP